MSEKARFTPIRGAEETLLNLPYTNGQLYFATDTGKMYLDCIDPSGEQKDKLSVGGGGVSVIYGNDLEPEALTEDENNVRFGLSLSALESKCHIGDLILNSDGCFYKVYEIGENKANCVRLAVSGSGGGGGGISTIDIFLDYDSSTIEEGYTYIYGARTYSIFTPRFQDGGVVSMTFTITDETGEANPLTFTAAGLPSGEPYEFDTSNFPLSSNITLTVKVSAKNSLMPGQARTWTFGGINTVQMGIKKANNNFQGIVLGRGDNASVSGDKILEFIPIGDSSKNIVETLHVYIDGNEDESYTRQITTFNTTHTINIARQSHGAHTIEFAVSTVVNKTEVMSDKISFDVAWEGTNNEEAPIIWINDYDKTVINYENSYVHYMVFDPEAYYNNLPASVILYKDGVMLNELQLTYSTAGWAEWDISSIYSVEEGKTVTTNVFSIACRGTKKDFSVDVTTVGSRDLGLVKTSSLISNFTSAGRSNLELKAKRSVWTDNKGNTATLSGFNWQTNGWQKDAIVNGQVDNGTYLCLTNGASVSIPCRSITMNDTDDYSIEVRFRVRNVQEYSTLVQVMPTYFYKDENNVSHMSEGDGKLLSEIQSNGWTVLRDEWGNMRMDENNTIKKTETRRGVICKWMDINEESGFCIGSQEAFFKTQRGTINVRYKEDEVINITFVVSHTDKLVYIYLNGILSGANSLPTGSSAPFTINSPFEFVSSYCDIDLYRLRVFQSGLTMPEVIHNYLSDLHSIALYDQNQLTEAIRPTQLSYQMLVDYNANNPDNLTMPYATWKIVTTGRQEKLPYYKGDKCVVNVKFVNPCLDAALEKGLIDEWFYYTHSPSFEAVGVEIDVQGTSSQGYPRRNYKTKYKSATPSEEKPNNKWAYTKGSLAGQLLTDKHTVLQTMDRNGNLLDTPVERSLAKKFHMDNEELSTNKFTWKIDYMESSGSYNTGFANLMGNLQHPLYSKHPLDDLGFNGSNMRTTVYGYPVLTFHEYTDPRNNPSNTSGSTDNAFKYEYIGRYNMNLDKSSNEYYGFESADPHPYVEDNPPISSIAECWELKDNQGTWCSFKYPNAQARSLGFGTLQDGYTDRLEMMRHFEYRYSSYADQLDAIGPDGKYDGIVDTTKPAGIAIQEEIGTTNTEKSAYARQVYRNLERLFNWLDSTDTNSATNNSVTPITWRTTVAYTSTGEVSTPVYGYVAVNASATFDPEEEYYVQSGANEYSLAELDPETGFIANVNYFTKQIIYYNTQFSNDTIGYRTEKFRNEFTKHLDKEYCLIYFIMTELLLCYDSRGKNMMLASWGPHELSGDYIWYPIFYDIDTQLGLNNSGAYLWDYDADVTADGLFSTPTSVLWTNFYAVFEDDIKNKYRVLRGINDGSVVSNNLNYENITGAYECNPEVFESYAMQGVRPVIAIGLDEYYKYFATTTDVGYFDTDGIKQIETSPQYAYCCQGDKKLTTELLLRNRLNYIDSWWLGGSHEINKVKQGQFWGRVNGNRIDKTSDIYIDLPAEEIAARAAMAADPESNLTDVQRAAYEKYNRAQAATYPKAYFDSVPGFTFKPFLKEYVSYFTDEVPGVPVKYTASEAQANGIKTQVPEGTVGTYKTEAESPNEQLVYIPGLDYLSSLGDLSTSYFSEFSLESGKRLLDLRLGSDVPGYKNALIDENKKFELHNGANDSGKKSLLKSMVMTGMTTFDKTLDMQGSAKLQEFRALNTKIPGVYFASGAPLHTVHLPSSVNSLELIENNDLTRILTSKPTVCTLDNEGVAHYTDAATYRGLYLEGITDYTNANANAGATLSSLVIEGSALKFDSYRLLMNLINLKQNATKVIGYMSQDTFNAIPSTSRDPRGLYVINGLTYNLSDNMISNLEDEQNAGGTLIQVSKFMNHTLKLSLKDVSWTPYVQVEYGATYDSSNSGRYYILTDHSSYSFYTYTTAEAWQEDTLNGNIYYLQDSALYSSNPITSLNFLNTLISLHDDKGFFTGMAANSMPTITGEVFVKNNSSNPIREDGLNSSDTYNLNYFKQYFPNLTIRAVAIEKSNITKFVQKLDTGKLETIDLLKTRNSHPQMTNTIPAKANFDFKGWATDVSGENMFVEYNNTTQSYTNLEDALNSFTFTQQNDTLVLYAIFEDHKHQVDFEYPDGTIKSMYIPYNQIIQTPSEIPWKDDSALEPTETYQFLGWGLDPTKTNVIDLTTFKITGDYLYSANKHLHAIFSPNTISVYNNIHPEYFEIVDSNFQHAVAGGDTQFGLKIRLAKAVKGKLTIPRQINNTNVICFCSNITTINNDTVADSLLADITYVFFEKDINGLSTVRKIEDNTFYKATKLKYCEFANGLLEIGARAFQSVNNLSELVRIDGTVKVLGQNCFTDSISHGSLSSMTDTLLVGGSVTTWRSSSFMNLNNGFFDTLQLGTEDSKMTATGFSNAFKMGVYDYDSSAEKHFNHVLVYAADKTISPYNSETTMLAQLFGNNNPYSIDDITII